MNGIASIAKPVQRATPNTSRPDLPPLTAYNAVSIWQRPATNDDGEVVPGFELTSMDHPIAKTGAALNAALDRIRASILKRDGKGFNQLEGYEFVALAVEPVSESTPQA